MNRSTYAFCHGERGARKDFLNPHRLRGVRPTGERVIAISDDIARRLVPRERFAELLTRPRRRWVFGHRTCTMRRRAWARITNTKSRRPVAVGTTKKSAAMSCSTWLVKNVRHVCDGGRRHRTMYFATVA